LGEAAGFLQAHAAPLRASCRGNLIEIKLDDYKNQFGVVFTGKVTAPKEGEYRFFLACDDGARLLVNGKKVVEHDGIHASTEIRNGKVKLAAGEHEVRVEYFQAAGGAELFAAWQGADFAITPLSKWMHPDWKEGAAKKEDYTPIVLNAQAEPVIYRNFISGAGNRAIGVGYPGGLNIAWSAESMNVALMWRGAFFDAGRHWRDRGGGHQPPLGFDVVRVTGEGAAPFAVMASPDGEWPKAAKNERAEGYKWLGYVLDAQRFPTFHYEWNGVKVSDRFDVEPGAALGEGKLIRTIRTEGKLPENALFRAAAGNRIEVANGGFKVQIGDHPLHLVVEGGTVAGKNLVVPARSEMKIIYSWPNSHAHHAHAH
jgi:hypothetical protein